MTPLFVATIFAGLVILTIALVDGLRGRTGFGSAVLTKQRSRDKFWHAIAIYANMAIVLFWLSGRLPPPERCKPGDEGCLVLIIEPHPK